MIIVRLLGGLGNQMFQYAIGRHLAKIQNTTLKLDIQSLENVTRFSDGTYRKYGLNIFNIIENIATPKEVEIFKKFEFMPITQNLYNVFISFFGKKIIKEQQHEFCKNIFYERGDLYLVGYWQNLLYFSDIENLIRKDFNFKFTLNSQDNELKSSMNNTPSVCLHVRRGDYVSNPIINKFHGACSLEYYQKALAQIQQKILNPHVFIFSDEIDWCKENLILSMPHRFVTDQDMTDSIERDFKLMTSCKHFIISNSTLSWWAAWLSQHPNKIIMSPQKWFSSSTTRTDDLIPKDWIKL